MTWSSFFVTFGEKLQENVIKLVKIIEMTICSCSSGFKLFKNSHLGFFGDKTFTVFLKGDVSGLSVLFFAGSADVLKKKGWHFVASVLCVLSGASVRRALCRRLKFGTLWMILGWKLGFSFKNPRFCCLLRSAKRVLRPWVWAEFSCLAVVRVQTFVQMSSWSVQK